MESQTKKLPAGLVIVNTGDGKGKTTSAIGQAIRAVGNGLKVCFIQFIKGKWLTGEAELLKGLDLCEFHTMDTGFTWLCEDKSEIIAKGQEIWKLAEQKVLSGAFDLVVLDELTYLISYQIVHEEALLQLIQKRPEGVHLVITGRNASSGLLDAADLVTEMKEIKHPFKEGRPAQKGIEY
jgi:cob(I)alamin adenosyltransferase